MRLRKPELKDKLPQQLCLLCDRPFCIDHKGSENGVCEINHETYYLNHPELHGYIYRTYEDWMKDRESIMTHETSVDEGDRAVGGGGECRGWRRGA